MKITIENDELVIRTPLDLKKASRSGNSTILATTRGQQYVGNVDGQPTYVQLNVMQMPTGAAGGGLFEVKNDQDKEVGSVRKAPGRAA